MFFGKMPTHRFHETKDSKKDACKRENLFNKKLFGLFHFKFLINLSWAVKELYIHAKIDGCFQS
jgi:hypothetical protein